MSRRARPQAATDIRTDAVAEGVELYATNCVVCHGATGEGMGAYPPLDNDGVPRDGCRNAAAHHRARPLQHGDGSLRRG
ncbi:c-type cytochrome [Nostocoides sp.]